MNKFSVGTINFESQNIFNVHFCTGSLSSIKSSYILTFNTSLLALV